MNTNRVINSKPIEDIDNDDDLLFTNKFVSQNSTEDLDFTEKENFKKYYENKQKNLNNKAILDVIDEQSIYDNFKQSGGSIRGSREPVVFKNDKHIIKTERFSIIDLDSINRDKNLYPYPNDFKVDLGKTFYNIKRIKLVSTAIPNTDQVITNTPIQIRNNTISWQNKEDVNLGIYTNTAIETVIPNTVNITIANHGFANQQRVGDFLVNISKSTSNPSIDGQWVATIIDDNTIQIPFYGGISITADATVDTGFPTYTVNLTPGNYNASTITTEIQKQLNLVKRRNNTGVVFHYFTVDISLDTDVITFRSYITNQLSTDPISTQAGTGYITVHSTSHGFKSGDYVLMIGVKNVGGISSSTLNGLFTITVLDYNSFFYEVNERASSAADGGGATCKTGKPSEFRLLFDTSNSIIVYNIGFPDEDSGQFINQASDVILTSSTKKSTSVQLLGNYIKFTSIAHGFNQTSIFTITGISSGYDPRVFLSSNHGLEGKVNVYLNYQHSTPALMGFYDIIISGNNTFLIDQVTITDAGSGSGVMKYGGDRIQLLNFKSIPIITNRIFYVENITTDTFQIEVPEGINSIQVSSISDTVISTYLLYINHPNHGFNSISSITPVNSTTAQVTTLVNHGLVGVKYTGISASTVVINTIDLVITNHGFSTSDAILISNSTTTPNIDGKYFIQTIDINTVRITFIGGVSSPGTCNVNKGDVIVFSGTNSIPDISTNYLDTVDYYIDYIGPRQFNIDTGFLITTPGNRGIIGRNNDFSLNRVLASEPGGDNFAGIPLTSINNTYHKIYKIIDEDNYVTNIGNYATKTYTGGGSNIVISSQKHGYRTFQSNTDTGEDTGTLFRSISLEGENYVFLISPNLQTVYSPGNEIVGDIFAKILLNESPGLMMFDSFISAPKDFNPPLAVLKNIQFTVKRKDGYLFNFNNTDYSISLEVTEIVDQIISSGISDRTGTSDIY